MNIRLNTVDIGVKECESNRSTHSKKTWIMVRSVDWWTHHDRYID